MDFNEVSCNIRSCLNSSARQLSLSQLSRDYESIICEKIPYRQLGFKSLEALIRQVKKIRVSEIRGEIFIDVQPDEKTAHIASLVQGQKPSKKKKKKSKHSSYRGGAPPPRRSYSGSGNIPPLMRSSIYPPKRSAPPWSSAPSSRSPDDYRTPRRTVTPPRRSPPRRRISPPKRPNPPDNSPIVISSDEDTKIREQIHRQFRSQPSQFDFSDQTELNNSDYDDADEINTKMEELKVTLGRQHRQVSINKPKLRGYPSSTSIEDDIEYSSATEKSALIDETVANEAASQGKGDMSNKRNVARGPAALLAAGRAMQEPNINQVINEPAASYFNGNSKPKSNFTTNRQPFKMMNTPTTNGRPSPTKSPIATSHPAVSPASNKMCETNMFKPAPYHEPDLSSNTYCGKLNDFTILHNLKSPQFKVFVKYDPRTKIQSFMCKIKIGSSLSFTSCPHESSQPKEAQEYTAKIALEELQKTYGNVFADQLRKTTDENEIVYRVAEIVDPYPQGLKRQNIEDVYKSTYGERLPVEWLDIIMKRSTLEVEELYGGNIAVYPVESREGVKTQSDVMKLPPLVLPETEVWNVFVTCCMSTSSISFRIIHDEYNGRYAVMDERMYEYYESMKSKNELRPVDVVKEGSFYVANIDEAWFRVKTLSTDVDDLVRVTLVDHGDIDEIPKTTLFPLDERFTSLPAQKVTCSLTGLEEYSGDPYVADLIDKEICGKAFVATVDGRNPLQLSLTDTSTEVDIDVNASLLERIEIELQPPKIPSQNSVTDAHLVSVKEDGTAFVQICSSSFKLLKEFLEEASEELNSNEDGRIKSTNQLLGSRIFLVKYSDGSWYRAIISRVESDDKIEVLFVDYGNLEAVKLQDIADADQFSPLLSSMPNQAIQVRLVRPNEELFTNMVLEFLTHLALPKASEATKFLLKTVKEGVIPDVMLFLRLPDTNELVNLNEIIASYFVEYRGPNHTGVKLSTAKSNLIKNPKRTEFRSRNREMMERVWPIRPRDIPPHPFTVFVTMVSSPFNFIVQPNDDQDDLTKLMCSMEEFYAIEQPLVDVDSIKEDEAYAVKTDSGKWYRGVVIKLFSGCISVKLIDYGDIVSIKYSDLAHLLPCFRSLPRQAIRAELAGVSPLHTDWSVEDSLRFKKLVSQKVLVSALVDVYDDGKISIILYDATAEPAIDIGAVLVEEGRAKDITAQ